MKKRGVAPLIATILIIGMVVIVGVVLANFFAEFSSKETERIEDKAFIADLCIKKTKLNFGRSCFIPSPNPISQIDIENEGAYPIEKIDFTFFSGNSSVQTYELNKSISKYGHGILNVTGLGGETERLGYIKYLRVDNETFTCDLVIIDVELNACS